MPLPKGADLVVLNSGVAHDHAAGDYNTRRAECERACSLLSVTLLRDVGIADLSRVEALPEPLRRRARHVVTECARVRAAEKALERGNLEALGEIMSEGHRSLANDYRVSVPAVDELVEDLLAHPGVLGARMAGGGFGGCVIALCTGDSPALDPMAHAPRRAWRISPAGRAALLET